MSRPLLINDWKQGIAPSPHEGMGLMRNVDIDSFPGAVKTSFSVAATFTTAYSGTFTADAGSDVITLTSANLDASNTTGIAVTVSSSGTLPAGLSSATQYFLIRVSSTTAKLAETKALADAGTAVDITGAGTGVHTLVTTNPGEIRSIVERIDGKPFMADSNGRVWFGHDPAYLLFGNTLTNGKGKGLVIFRNSTTPTPKTILIVFRNNAVDACDVSADSNLDTPVWTNSWQSLNSSAGSDNSHHAIVGQDNIIYFCDDRWVGSIRETGALDPAAGTGYTYSDTSLDLPQGEIAEWLDELGQNLMIAGSSFDKIYPWDRRSDSFFLPIAVGEESVKRIKNINNTLYILAGVRGNVYRTQGSVIDLVAKIPDSVSDNSDSGSNQVTWGSIGAKNGNLLAGASVQTTGNSGVYMITPAGRVTIDNMPATGSGQVTALYSGRETYRLGYSGGAALVNRLARYSNYETVVNSPLYPVASRKVKGSYSTLEVQLAKPTAGGSSVRVGYRRNTSGSFTTLATFSTDGTNTSFDSDIGLTDLENLQVQLELSGSVEVVSALLT